MLGLARRFRILEAPDPSLVYEHNDDKVIVFDRAGLLFAFNFHPTRSHPDYRIDMSPGSFTMIFNSDHRQYGGHQRLVPEQKHFSIGMDRRHVLSLYLPTRTALVLMPDEYRASGTRSET